MRTKSLGEFERASARIGRLDVVTRQFQERCASIRRIPIVVDNQDLHPGAGHGSVRLHFDIGRLLCRGSDRQSHDELASTARSVAVRFHAPTVQSHEPAHQRQSDAEPALGASQGCLGLREHLEQSRHHVRGNTNTVIPDRDDDLTSLPSCPQLDVAAGIGILGRIDQKVEKPVPGERRLPEPRPASAVRPESE